MNLRREIEEYIDSRPVIVYEDMTLDELAAKLDRVLNSRVLQLVQFQTGILPLYDKGFILSSFCYFSVVLYCVMWYNSFRR